MSLILDALNRSRQDASPVPGLDTQHRAEPISATRLPHLLWAALALCGVVIAVLVIDRLRTPSAPAEDIGAPVAQLSQNLGSAVSSVTTELKARAAAAGQAQQPVAPAQPPAAQQDVPVAAANPPPALAAQAAAPVSPSMQAVVVNQAGVAAPAPAESERTPPAAESGTARPPAPAQPGPARSMATETARNTALSSNSSAQDPEVAELYQHPDKLEQPSQASASTRSRSQTAAPKSEEPVDLDKILKLAQEEIKNAKLEDNSVPLLADLSQHVKDGIPTIYYQKHDYSSDPSVSSVTLNGTTAKVGGSPIPGLKVEQILRDSVILSFQGTQFRLRALNSWVNL
jgi:hypothetical protein